METTRKREVRCLECNSIINFGRSDRKFCCEKCKNKYNNRRLGATRNIRLRVRNAIEKNYEILEKLLSSNVKAISMSDLTLMGYKFNFITFHQRVRGHNEYWCYDIKYFLSDSKLFRIERMNNLV